MVFARRTAQRQLFELLGHRDLIDVGRVSGGDRRHGLGLGGRGRALLHARGQPFGEPRQQPAGDEVNHRGHDQRLQDVEVHRAESARFLQQVGIHDDRA